MSEESRLRRLWALGSSDAEVTHLEEEAWERLACGEMPAAERQRALDHVTVCAECAQVYRALSLLQEQARDFDPGVPEAGLAAAPPARRHAPRYVWAGLAAAAVLLLVALPTDTPEHVSTPPQAGPDGLRGGSEASRPQPLAPMGSVSVPPAAFSWQGVPGARAYRIELLSGDGEPLWDGETAAGTSLDWPGEVPVKPGRYYWRVLALSEGGGEPKVSELAAFELLG